MHCSDVPVVESMGAVAAGASSAGAAFQRSAYVPAAAKVNDSGILTRCRAPTVAGAMGVTEMILKSSLPTPSAGSGRLPKRTSPARSAAWGDTLSTTTVTVASSLT